MLFSTHLRAKEARRSSITHKLAEQVRLEAVCSYKALPSASAPKVDPTQLRQASGGKYLDDDSN